MDNDLSYLTPSQVGEILNFKKTKIYALINQRDFPKIKIGRDIRVPEIEFKAWLKRNKYKR